MWTPEFALPLQRVCKYLSVKDVTRLSGVNAYVHKALGSSSILRTMLNSKYETNSTFLVCKKELLNLHFLLEHQCRFGARQMGISWGETPEYWAFKKLSDTFFDEVAVLKSVCWLDVRLEYKRVPRGKYTVSWQLDTEEFNESVDFFVDVLKSDKGKPKHSPRTRRALACNTRFKRPQEGGGWWSYEVGTIEVNEPNCNVVMGFWNHSGSWKSGISIDFVELKWVGDATPVQPEKPSISPRTKKEKQKEKEKEKGKEKQEKEKEKPKKKKSFGLFSF